MRTNLGSQTERTPSRLSDLTLTKAIILGIVQGLTEFLPVSSSAHLVFAQKLLNLDPKSDTLILFDILAHVGTLIAMAVVFGHTLMLYLKRLVRESSPAWTRERLACRFMILGIIASIPTAAIGLAFKHQLEESLSDIKSVGFQLIISGVLLVVVIMLPRGKRGWREFKWTHALLIGVGQGAALIPGISRSGCTISVAGYCGIRRRWAADFSFFIVAPAILGALALEMKDVLELPKDQLAQLPWSAMIWGSAISMIVGILSLWLLLRVVRRAHLHWFAPYCWVAGLLAVLGVFSN